MGISGQLEGSVLAASWQLQTAALPSGRQPTLPQEEQAC